MYEYESVSSVTAHLSMKLILFFCAYLHSMHARARSQNPEKADIVNYSFDLDESGSFSYSFTTRNGFHHDAKGELKNVGTSEEGLAVKGTYFYMDTDGFVYNVKYVADDKGFQPIIKVDKPSDTPIVLRTGAACISTLCGTGLG